MQITASEFLPIAEQAGAICFFDIEATGLKGDYNSMLVASVKPYQQKPITFSVTRPGADRSTVRQLRDELEKYAVWVSFYGKGFDVPFIRTRLLHHGCTDLERRHHIDMYYTIKFNTLTARRSQAHLLEFLDAPQRKMTLSPELWNEVLRNPTRGLRVLRARCESDVAGLEALYDRAKTLIREIQR